MDEQPPTLDYVSRRPKPPPAPFSPRFYLAALTMVPVTFIVFTVGIGASDSPVFRWLCGSMFFSIPILFAIGLGLQLTADDLLLIPSARSTH